MTQGQLVRETRKKLGMSQGALASHLKYSSSQFISNIERNICGIPPDEIKVYADLLRIEPRKLLKAGLKRIIEDYCRKAGLKLRGTV